MSADRCPSCAASVRPDAQWCSQCYADLRPAPPPPPPPAPAPAPVPEQLPPAPVEAPQAFAQPAAATVLADELPPALPGVVPSIDQTPPAWPCGRCRTLVPFDDDTCPNCGARFLASELPGVDKTLLDRLPQGQRKASTAWLVMVLGGLLLTAIFVGLFALLGVIF